MDGADVRPSRAPSDHAVFMTQAPTELFNDAWLTQHYVLNDFIYEESYSIAGDKSQSRMVQVYMLARLSLGS